MRLPAAEHQRIEFSPTREVKPFDLVFTGCRAAPDRQFYDIVDFAHQRIDRWWIPVVRLPRALQALRQRIAASVLGLGHSDHETFYVEQYMTPHVAQLSPGGKLFVSFGVSESGFGVVVIDTRTGESELLPPDAHLEPMLCTSTGDFSADHKDWVFARWPFRGRESMDSFEILKVDVESLSVETLWKIGNGSAPAGLPRKFHQITRSADGRYAVCAPFDFEHEEAPSPGKPAGGGLRLEKIVTVDLVTGRSWTREIPWPVPAHIEFHPSDPRLFYASAHNISIHTAGTMLEGPATLFQLRITGDDTEIVGSYTEERLYRVTQHSLFQYRGKTLLALTCVPNHLVLLDADTMELWRKVEVFPSLPLTFGEGKVVISPPDSRVCYSVNPSRSGSKIVLEDARNFLIYDVDEDRILPETISRSLPPGGAGRGHTRTLGQ